MELLSAALAGVIAGLLHAFGPDHLAALASLCTGERTRAVSTGLRFGMAHGLSLALLACVCGFMGYVIPPSFETAAEVGGGALLFLLGAATLLGRPRGLVVHRHLHDHASGHGQQKHAHWHVHLDEIPDRHGHLHSPFAVGGLLALSGLRGLLLALPPFLAAANGKQAAIAFVVCFSVGVAAAMTACGVVLRWLLQRGLTTERLAVRAHRIIAGATALVGVAWMWSHWP